MRARNLWGLFAALISGTTLAAGNPLLADIREYEVPTPKSRPHDPAVAPDGSLWVTEQEANKVGRLDPKTGKFREYPLKEADSGPHGLVADKDGRIWFTANSKGYIGRLDPSTGDVAEYPMPDPKVRDPHTPVFDRTGVLWFTAQQANVVGRLDPKTGGVKLKKVAAAHSRPYGIAVSRDGVPYFVEFGSNKIASIDPKSMKISEYILPDGSRPRRLAFASDGTLYYSDFARGYLGHFDPKTHKVEEWPSPGGKKSQPYGIAVTPDGMIWYSESGVTPNTLVRFDPKAKSFSSIPIPSGGGVVRNMAATSDGRLYLACSGVNKVAIAVPAQSRSELAVPR